MSVKVAIEGCCHGELNAIYKSLKPNVELLIICGDFQAIRNKTDLATMNVPKKYLRMADFHQYYLGEKKAPVLTIFIGGNHECSLYLRELQFGGWVAPNIYYLGEFGSVWFKGLRITAMSGIWNWRTFSTCFSNEPPKYSLPYLELTIKSAYHVKPKNYLKFLLSGPSDIALSHDWPQYVWEWGDSRQLLRHKPYFREDMDSGRLGSPLAGEALAHLKSRYWFSLHLHTRFTALVKHRDSRKKQKVERKPESSEIELDMDFEVTDSKPKDVLDEVELKSSATEKATNSEIDLDFDGEACPQTSTQRELGHSDQTHFLALDKCLPRKRFLEFMDIEPLLNHGSLESDQLFYDARGLAVQKVIEDFVNLNSEVLKDIGPSKLMHVSKISGLLSELEDSVKFEERKIAGKNLQVPLNFEQIAPDSTTELKYWPSNQTNDLCEKFKIPKPDLNGH